MFEETDEPSGVVGVEDIVMSDVVWKNCSVLLPVEAVEGWLICVGGFCGKDDCCPPPVCGFVGCPCAGWLLLFPEPELLWPGTAVSPGIPPCPGTTLSPGEPPCPG